MTKNLKAFLDMIAWSEIGPGLLAVSDNGYNVLVGSTAAHPLLFTDYSHHPRIHNNAQNSDAAGRYQLMGRYYEPYRQSLNLKDVSPASQDAIALQQIKECRALDDIEAGRIIRAIQRCAHIWASFPGAGYGQHEQQIGKLLDAYTAAGGSLA